MLQEPNHNHNQTNTHTRNRKTHPLKPQSPHPRHNTRTSTNTPPFTARIVAAHNLNDIWDHTCGDDVPRGSEEGDVVGARVDFRSAGDDGGCEVDIRRGGCYPICTPIATSTASTPKKLTYHRDRYIRTITDRCRRLSRSRSRDHGRSRGQNTRTKRNPLTAIADGDRQLAPTGDDR